MKHKAVFKIYAEVEFDDDGLHDLKDQAFEAAEELLPIHHGFDIELIAGSLEPTS